MRITIDTSDLKRQLKAIEAANRKAGEDEAVKMAFDLQKELKRAPPIGTPVDSGTARAGWDVDATQPGGPIVQNNVEYIVPLNDGHSSQSPAGFVEAAIDKIRQKFSR